MNVRETTGIRAVLVHAVDAAQPDGWFVRCRLFVANEAAPSPWKHWKGVETDEPATCLACLGIL